MDPKTLFTSPYDQKTFTKLLKGLLGEEYQDEGRYETKEIGQGFEYLTHYSRLGDIELDNGGYKEQVLVLEITQKSINDARVSITKETIKLLKKDIFQGYYTVLVAFRSEANPDNWRFSLIKSNDGKSWNNAKRFSYYLGLNEGYKTPEQYIWYGGKIKSERKSDVIVSIRDLKDLVSRFDVEVVRENFFNLYLNLFIELYKEVVSKKELFHGVNRNKVDLVSFSKNLMGKMIFLYFIQRKGRLGLKESEEFGKDIGSITFFKENFDNLTFFGSNFYNDFLEPLFYSGLNDGTRINDRHPTLKMKVPYLNGGLFEEEYKNRDGIRTELDNELFRAIIVSFDTYNFTIDENDPMDQDIAVDPEMLGKIFEYMISITSDKIGDLVELYNQKKKFNGYPNPDKNINIVSEIRKSNTVNKKLGAFYTPREIVHYMTRESLIYSVINFLTTNGIGGKSEQDREELVRKLFDYKDQHASKGEYKGGDNEYQSFVNIVVPLIDFLKNIKILDLAVGSGAFPMGILYEIVGLRKYLMKTFDEHLKEISDFDVKYETIRDAMYGVDIDPGAIDIARLRFWLSLIVDAKTPTPLPNFEFKFVSANSLIPIEERLFTLNLDTIKKYFREYYKANNEIDKKDRQDRIERYIGVGRYRQELLLGEERNRQIRSWEPFIAHTNSADFFDPKIMFAQGSFDIIIGNPPYIKERDNADVFSPVNNSSFGQKYHQGKMDYWFYFLHKAIDLCKKGGYISFITNSYWIKSDGSSKLIDRIERETVLDQIIDLGDLKVFPSVSGKHMIHHYKNRKSTDDDMTFLLEVSEKDFNDGIIDRNKGEFVNTESLFDGSKIQIIEHSRFFKGDKIKPLGLYYDVSQGVVEASDKISKKTYQEKSNKAPIGSGVFVLSKQEINQIGCNGNELGMIKKYLNTNDINRYSLNYRDEYLIYSGNKEKALIENNKDYTNIKKHLDFFQYAISSSNGPYGIHRTREQRFFDEPKLICKGMFKKPEFTYDESKFYVGMSFSVIIEKNKSYQLKYLLACMNSKYGEYWFTQYGKKRGVGVDIGVKVFRQFPVYEASKNQQDILESVVDYILIDKKNNIDTSNLERKIDILVYKLYELTLEDSQIIDPTLTQEEWDKVDFE